MKIIFKLLIRFFELISLFRGYFHTNLNYEISSLIGKDETDIDRLKYISDKLFGFIPWNWILTADNCMERNGGDCNSLNRVWQVYYHMHRDRSYLLTVLTRDWKRSHAVCVVQKSEGYYIKDQQKTLCYCGLTEKDVLNKFEFMTKTKVRTYVIEDIHWNYVKLESIK